MPETFFKLAQITLGSAFANVNLSSISQNYTHLLLLTSARSSSGSSYYANGFIRPNNSTSGFSGLVMEGTSGTPVKFLDSGGSIDGIRCDFPAPGSASSANFNVSETWFHNYSNTTAHKTGIQEIYIPNQSTNSTFIDRRAWHWANASAVSSLMITTAGNGTFVTGSTFTLYGIGQLGSTNSGTATVSTS
jgi:hypothetical protein